MMMMLKKVMKMKMMMMVTKVTTTLREVMSYLVTSLYRTFLLFLS